ncbi:hypothetical protein OPIT5_12325 [Opitutaceae bacterium TAV5]|nr:hypothetical protein OPIT5_12325 [Opitutaceae bacterium TAV5]
MSACFDTSVLVSLYMRDANWQEAVSLVSAHKGAVWTPWQRLEFNNAVRAHVARGNIDIAAVRKIEETIRLSIENRDMIPRPLPAGCDSI